MFARQLCFVHHKLPPCGVDSVRYFGRICVVEARCSPEVFDGVLIRQDLNAHTVDFGMCLLSSPCPAHCIAEYFRFVWMQFESSLFRC